MKYKLAIWAMALGVAACGSSGTAMAQERASIGVSIRDVRSADTGSARLSKAEGAYIESVQSGTPAEKAGLKAGDIVLEFDGEHVRGARHFARLVEETPVGRSVGVAITRGGTRQTLSVAPEETRGAVRFQGEELGERIERGLRDLQQRRPPGNDQRLGVALMPLSEQLAAYFGVKSGVLVSEVVPDSAAARAGVRAGDVITTISGQRVSSPADVVAILRQTDQPGTVDLTLVRDRRETHAEAQLKESRRVRPREPVGI